MNPKMQRSKVLAVVAALVAAGTAAIVFAGGASAASWHVYDGDVFAGHAYALQVPAGAETVEFILDGPEGATASLSVYGPDGGKLGHFALSDALPAASIANPQKGQHAIYVYELGDGALTVRVNTKEAPSLALSELPLLREEVKVGTFANGRLDQVITTQLARAPVFVTLLYEGSASGLDATVASEKGTVVTVTDETATAFSPGVWTSLRGERAFDAANLAGTLYTVEVHAERFEGTMVLTTLALDLRPRVEGSAPVAPPTPTRLPGGAPTAVPASPAQFALVPETPIAFMAPAGKLLLVDPEALAQQQAEERNETYEGDDDCLPLHAIVSVYAPDDSLLAVVELSHDEPTAELELPVAGEYVAYVRHAQSEVVLAKIEGTPAAPAVRALEVATERFEIQTGALLFGDEEAEVVLARAPLDLGLRFVEGFGALARVSLLNENGVVATADSLLMPTPGMVLEWSRADYALFAAGTHAFEAEGAFEGTVELVTTYYLRDIEVALEAPAEHDEHEGHEGHGGHEGMPIPPGLPMPGAAPLVPDLF